jgi:tetratricopeptide (TPR) repeat protein
MFALVTALAASLLLVLARGVFDFEPADGGSVIAMAQRDLDQGRPGEAFARLETYLSGGPDVAEDQRVRAAAILESSGYQLARGGLVQGDFSRVSDIEHRVSRHSGGSSRLLNLRIQAERGETSERSLAARMSLLEHYDYELDGRQVIKSLTIRAITDTDRRIEAGLQAAIAAYPDELDLRLNYGQLLLDQRHFERAEAEFAAAVAADPQNALAHTGLGLAILEQADDEDDRREGRQVLGIQRWEMAGGGRFELAQAGFRPAIDASGDERQLGGCRGILSMAQPRGRADIPFADRSRVGVRVPSGDGHAVFLGR